MGLSIHITTWYILHNYCIHWYWFKIYISASHTRYFKGYINEEKQVDVIKYTAFHTCFVVLRP